MGRSILWFVLLFLNVHLDYLRTFELFNAINDFSRITSFAVILLMYIMNKRLTKLTLCLLIYISMQIVLTLIGHGDFYLLLNYQLYIVNYVILAELMIEKDARTALCVILFLFEILIYINLFTIIAFPNGLYYNTGRVMGSSRHAWFLGDDGQHIDYFLIATIVALLMLRYGNTFFTKVRSCLLIVACIFSTVAGSMATGIVTMLTVIVVFFLMCWINKLEKMLTAKNVLFVSLAVNVLIVIFRMQERFSSFFEVYLERDVTFTGRTRIWDIVLYYIYRNPILGNGFGNSAFLRETVGSIHAWESHNQLLQFTFEGGLFFLSLVIVYLFTIARKIDRRKDYYSIVGVSIFAGIMVTCLTRSPFTGTMVLFMVIPILCGFDHLRIQNTYIDAEMKQQNLFRKKRRSIY